MARNWLKLISLCALAVAAPIAATPTHKSLIKADFAFPQQAPVRIILFRPDVAVGEQTTAGMDAPNAAWTELATENLTAALGKAQAARNIEVKLIPALAGEDEKTMAGYRKLFRAVADSIISNQLYAAETLPTKGENFDWTLGSGASRLGEIGGGDYGLFIYSADSYESASRRTARLIGTMLGGGDVSEVNIGYAGLVDLKSGDIVWINVDVKIGGDVRTAQGAERRIAELLADFPQRIGFKPAKAMKK